MRKYHGEGSRCTEKMLKIQVIGLITQTTNFQGATNSGHCRDHGHWTPQEMHWKPPLDAPSSAPSLQLSSSLGSMQRNGIAGYCVMHWPAGSSGISYAEDSDASSSRLEASVSDSQSVVLRTYFLSWTWAAAVIQMIRGFWNFWMRGGVHVRACQVTRMKQVHAEWVQISYLYEPYGAVTSNYPVCEQPDDCKVHLAEEEKQRENPHDMHVHAVDLDDPETGCVGVFD